MVRGTLLNVRPGRLNTVYNKFKDAEQRGLVLECLNHLMYYVRPLYRLEEVGQASYRRCRFVRNEDDEEGDGADDNGGGEVGNGNGNEPNPQVDANGEDVVTRAAENNREENPMQPQNEDQSRVAARVNVNAQELNPIPPGGERVPTDAEHGAGRMTRARARLYGVDLAGRDDENNTQRRNIENRRKRRADNVARSDTLDETAPGLRATVEEANQTASGAQMDVSVLDVGSGTGENTKETAGTSITDANTLRPAEDTNGAPSSQPRDEVVRVFTDNSIVPGARRSAIVEGERGNGTDSGAQADGNRAAGNTNKRSRSQPNKVPSIDEVNVFAGIGRTVNVNAQELNPIPPGGERVPTDAEHGAGRMTRARAHLSGGDDENNTQRRNIGNHRKRRADNVAESTSTIHITNSSQQQNDEGGINKLNALADTRGVAVASGLPTTIEEGNGTPSGNLNSPTDVGDLDHGSGSYSNEANLGHMNEQARRAAGLLDGLSEQLMAQFGADKGMTSTDPSNITDLSIGTGQGADNIFRELNLVPPSDGKVQIDSVPQDGVGMGRQSRSRDQFDGTTSAGGDRVHKRRKVGNHGEGKAANTPMTIPPLRPLWEEDPVLVADEISSVEEQISEVNTQMKSSSKTLQQLHCTLKLIMLFFDALPTESFPMTVADLLQNYEKSGSSEIQNLLDTITFYNKRLKDLLPFQIGVKSDSNSVYIKNHGEWGTLIPQIDPYHKVNYELQCKLRDLLKKREAIHDDVGLETSSSDEGGTS